METAEGTKALVDLEDRRPSVLFETFGGSDVHAWPFLRWPMAQSMAEVELGQSSVGSHLSTTDRVRRLFALSSPNARGWKRAPHRDVLFVVSGHRIASVDGRWAEWLIGEFASSHSSQSVIVQDRPLPRQRSSRSGLPLFPDTYSSYDEEVMAGIRMKLRPLTEDEKRRTARFVAAAYRELDFPVDQERIEVATRKVLRNQAKYTSMARTFERLLERVSPRLVVMDGASYGGIRGLQTRIARERGILVAEPQHGWIGSSHGAYNFGAAMSEEPLRGYLPDDLLTFGRYWSSSIRTPSNTIEIGKAHIARLSATAPPWQERTKAVLVASNAYRPAELIATARQIRDALPPDWHVIFRPHPSERWMGRYDELHGEDRITLDPKADVYASLATVRGVVSYASTVLFEAAALGCPPFVLDSPLANLYVTHPAVNNRITDSADLTAAMVALAAQPSAPQSSAADLESLWHPDPIGAYDDYVTSVLGTSSH